MENGEKLTPKNGKSYKNHSNKKIKVNQSSIGKFFKN